MSDEPRGILHVDMDAFFASVEQLDQPALRGKPVLVGGEGRRGVVAAASYEARAFGCHSAQPMVVAKRLCPDAIVVPPRGSRYGGISKRVFKIFREFTPIVEPLSIDEAFLDVTGSRRLFGSPVEIARRIKDEVREKESLTASVGVAPNKFLAKLGSGLEKPDGLTVIDATWIADVLPTLPIRRMWGIGPAGEAKMHALGIETFADLAARDDGELRGSFGRDAGRLCRLARGQDVRTVVPERSARSISHEQTFGQNLEQADDVRDVILRQSERVAARLRDHGLRGRTVTVKIRFGDFETITRSCSLPEATDRTDVVWEAARDLFDRWAETGFVPVRLIGVGVSHFTAGDEQLDLFTADEDERRKELDRVTDEIQARFGGTAIRRGRA